MVYKYATVIALLAGAVHFMGNSSSQQKSTLIVTGQGATEVQPDIAKVRLTGNWGLPPCRQLSSCIA